MTFSTVIVTGNVFGRLTICTNILKSYFERTSGSRIFFERAQQCLPGGETRAVTFYPPYPVAIDRGAGPMLVDIDGNAYLDVLNNYTALVHGHAFPPILEAIGSAAARGSVIPAPHSAQVELAEALVERYSAVDLVRFTSSGSEAALLALRIARAVTGRRRLVLFEGAYHGTGPQFVDADNDVIRIPYNDSERAAAQIDAGVAAVFAEPFLGSAGVIQGNPEFFLAVQDAARRAGALFIIDEVQSLRNNVHGEQAALGLDPDLTLMGKVVGGGFPIGVVGGKARILGVTAANRKGALLHAGTFNGNVVSTAAGLVSLKHLDRGAIGRLNLAAEILATRIEEAGLRVGLPTSVTRSGSILHVHLSERPPRNAAEAGQSSPRLSEALHLALLLEGIYAAPRGMLNLSTVMTDGNLQELANAYGRALSRVSQESEAVQG